jgi:uncharacterized DUF497 family protein
VVRIDWFRVSASAARHMIDKHGVSPEEAQEGAESSPIYRRGRSVKGGERRYLVPGKTEAGRRLWVVVADEGGGQGRIITAWEARDRADIARHKRLRGE